MKPQTIQNKIYLIRGQRVMLDFDLTGHECPKEDLPQLNIFMRPFCKSLIDWKEQHPEIELK